MYVSNTLVLNHTKLSEPATNSMSDDDLSILLFVVIIAISICLVIPPQFVLDSFRSLLTRRGERRSICLLALIFYFIFRNDIELALVLIAVALGSVLMVATFGNFIVDQEVEDGGEDGREHGDANDCHPVFGRHRTLRTLFQRLSLFWIVVNCEPGLKWLDRSQVNFWNGIFLYGMNWRLCGELLLLAYHAYDFIQNGRMVNRFWRTVTTYLVLIAANEQNLNEEEREKRAFVLYVIDVCDLSVRFVAYVALLVMLCVYPVVIYLFVAWVVICLALLLLLFIVFHLNDIWKLLRRKVQHAIRLHSLPRATAEQLALNDDVCLVCHEQMHTACVTPCNHFYHPNCLGNWLLRSDKCPMCQRVL